MVFDVVLFALLIILYFALLLQAQFVFLFLSLLLQETTEVLG